MGSVIIVCGLYIVLWGKDKEIKKVSQLVPNEEGITDVKSSSRKGSSHGGSSKREGKEEEEREEIKRDSQVGSEILGGIYIYH